MKNKKLFKNVVYLVVLTVILAASAIPLFANKTSCGGGTYMNRQDVELPLCVCGDKTIEQNDCEFGANWCTKLVCYQM